jgi:O-antigen/teichoic acid export membrane protein
MNLRESAFKRQIHNAKRDKNHAYDQPKLSICRLVTARDESRGGGIFAKMIVRELKMRSVRGGLIALSAQGMKFVLQMGSVMILARLLSPEDFGLQGMVVAMTGFLLLFRDAGLSMATVQRDVITHEQTSTLFWINITVGAVLAVLAVALAPALAAFYHEPRLFGMAIVSAAVFFFNGLAAQHNALLQRGMRFVTIAKIDVSSLAISSAVAIGIASLGFGYWALVGSAVCGSIISAAGAWLSVPWLPGRPTWGSGVRSMLHFGGAVTCNGLVVYLGYNTEKVLLGRFSGAEALGLYGRAYQLINLPMSQLHTSIFAVAFPALSRIQGDPQRQRNSFLKGYSVILSMTIPATICSILFAEEIVQILLGMKWIETAPIFRLLGPTVLAFALINPLGWFLMATGRAARSLKIALLIAPVVILAIVIGLRYGPRGVAMGYSIAMTLLIIPVIAWAKHDTGIKSGDFWKAIKRPLLSGLLAGASGLALKVAFFNLVPAIPRLLMGLGLVLGVYAWMLLIVYEQKGVYHDLLNQVLQRRDQNEGISPITK